MNINAYIIKDYLSIQPTSTHLVSNRSVYEIDEIVFFSSDLKLQRNQVVIMYSCDFTKYHNWPGTYLCIGNEYPMLSDCQDVLFFSDAYNEYDIYNDVIAVMKKFYHWEKRLNDLLINNSSLRNFGDVTLPFLTNPITLYTSSHRNIFASEQPDMYGHTLFNEKDIQAYLSVDELEEIQLDQEFADSINKIEPTIFSNHIWGYRILFYNIRLSNIYVARLMTLETKRSLRDSDFSILKMLAEYLTIALTKKDLILNNHPKDFDDRVMDLINSKEVNENYMESLLEKINWHANDMYFCVYMVISNNQTMHALTAECAGMENSLPACITIPQNRSILLIANLTIGHIGKEDFLSRLSYFLRESLLKAGASMTFENFFQLSSYYMQAVEAYQIGNAQNEMIWCHQYEDYALSILMNNARKAVLAETLIPPGLKALMKYDSKNNRSYTESLKVYLQNDRNVAICCRKLFFHRATFLYHLKRIREITGYDFDDYHLRLYLLMIFEFIIQE